jgi:DNA polymerase-3 subunit delta
MVSDASEAMIWNLTDALSQRNPRKAMQSLQALRRGDTHPLALLAVIARQYRLMLIVKEMAERTRVNVADIAKELRMNAYPVQKAMQQAASYTFPELVDILDRLADVDYAMKTGADMETEIDLLIAELTQKAPSRASYS